MDKIKKVIKSMKKITQTVRKMLPFIGFLIVLAIVFYQIFTMPDTKYFFGWDTMDIQYFTRSFYRQALSSFHIPWWDPYQFSGTPFAAGVDGPIFFYPLSLLFVALPVSQALSWFYVIHLFLAMAGMYLFMRRWASSVASWAGGVVFGLSGYFVPRVLAGTAGNLASASWLPFVFLSCWRVFESRGRKQTVRTVIVASLIICLQFLAGDQRMGIYTLMGVCISSVVVMCWQRNIRPILKVITSMVFGFSLSSLQTIPILEFMQLSGHGKIPSYDFASNGSLTADRLKELVYPFAHVFTPNIGAYPPFPESPFYTGIIPLVLACSCLILLFIKGRELIRNPSGKRFVVIGISLGFIALFAFWVSLGSAAPVDIFYLFWRYLPMFSFVRIPTRFLLLFAFGVAGLTGLLLTQIKHKILVACIVICILVEMLPFARSYVLVTTVPETRHNTELMATLTDSKGQLFRVHPNYFYTERLGYSMDMNAASHYRYFSTQGYSALMLSSYVDFYTNACLSYDPTGTLGMNQLPPMWDIEKSCLDFLNVKYVYGRGDLTTTDATRFKLIMDDFSSWFRLYENVAALPRFFLANQAMFYSNETQITYALRTGMPDIHSTVLLVSPDRARNHPIFRATCLENGTGAVRVESYGINAITLSTNTPCDTYLVSSEVMYPGWMATIDGKSVPIQTGNLAFRTIFVPAGSHTIIMQYIPRIFILGGIISLLTAIGMIVVFIKTNRV